MSQLPVSSSDARHAAQHATDAEDFMAEAGRVPEGLMIGFLIRSAAHASLAVYYELRAQR